MAGLAVSELEKRNNALLVWNKINKKDGKDNSFELNDGKEVNLKFNPDVKNIAKYFKAEDIEEIKDLSKPKSTKMFFVDTKGKEYKLTDLKKTAEFGGGGGSGLIRNWTLPGDVSNETGASFNTGSTQGGPAITYDLNGSATTYTSPGSFTV